MKGKRIWANGKSSEESGYLYTIDKNMKPCLSLLSYSSINDFVNHGYLFPIEVTDDLTHR